MTNHHYRGLRFKRTSQRDVPTHKTGPCLRVRPQNAPDEILASDTQSRRLARIYEQRCSVGVAENGRRFYMRIADKIEKTQGETK